MTEWVVLELTPQGEEEDPDVLRASILRILRGSEVFVPASVSVVGGSRVVHKLIDNYVFVRRTTQPDSYYYKTENTKYVSTVLTAANSRVRRITTIKDSDVSKMRKQIQVETDQGIELGDEVEIMSGAYKGIRARVIEEILEIDSVQVFVSLRSKQAIVTLPRSFLRFVVGEGAPESSFSPFRIKYLRIMEWFRRAKGPLSVQVPSVEVLETRYSNTSKLLPWANSFDTLVREHTYRRRVNDTPLPSLIPVKGCFDTTMLLYQTYRADRWLGLATTLPQIPDDSGIIKLAANFDELVKLAPPLLALTRQSGAGDDLTLLVDISDIGGSENHQYRRLETYARASQDFNRLKFQIGQIESKLKKAEQEDVKERKRRSAKRHR